MVAVVRRGRGVHCPSASSWLCHWRCILTETKLTVVLMIADICITICWWTTKSKSANISPVVGYSRTGKVHLFTCLPTSECDLHVSWFVRDIVSVCRPGSVLKPKPQFWGKPNQNRKLSFDRGPSRFWSHTGQTEGVAHSLNDAVFKLFLTDLLNDNQCYVGGRSGARGKVHCRRLSDRANKPLHNVRPSSRRRPWGVRCQREPGVCCHANLDVCCRRILIVVPPDTDRSFTQNLHFTLDA